jgi:hypothetical protein
MKTPQLQHPSEILRAHVEPAIKSQIKTLRALCEEDIELTRAVDESWPGKAGEDSLRLWERACDNDKAAEAELQKWGGRDGYEAMRQRHHDFRVQAHRNAAYKSREAIMKLAEAAKPAVDAARVAVQKQFDQLNEWLGENPARTNWGHQFGAMLTEMEKADWRPQHGWGAMGMVTSFGLSDIIMGEAK